MNLSLNLLVYKVDWEQPNQAITSSQIQSVTPSTSITSTLNFIEIGILPAVAVTSISNIIAKTSTTVETPSDLVQSIIVSYSASVLSGVIQHVTAVVDTKRDISIETQVYPSIETESINSIISKSISIIDTNVTVVSSSELSSSPTKLLSVVQSIQSNYNLRKESLEVLLIPPPTGVVDGYTESSFVSDPINTRLNGFVDLVDTNGFYFVTQRSLNEIQIRNSLFGSGSEYIGTYTRTNAGHRISHFSGIFDDGSSGVSGMTIQEIDTYYPSLTLQDFTERANSSYTLAGDYFNLLPPSIQNPVTLSQTNGTVNSTISVQKTTYFPSSGYVITDNGGVIQYTGKTSTTFTGCTVIRGSNTLSIGTVIVPFQLT